MPNEYYTVVKASPGFWQKLLLKKIDEDSHIEIHSTNPDEIIITSKNRSALDKIIALSKEYPEEIFHVKIEGDNVYGNYVKLFKCLRGQTNLVKEGFEYVFCIKASDREKLDRGVFDTFKKKIANFFVLLEQKSRTDVNSDLNFDDLPVEGYDEDLLITLEYITDKARLTAKRYGITYINVDVDFFDKTGILHGLMQPSYVINDDVPF